MNEELFIAYMLHSSLGPYFVAKRMRPYLDRLYGMSDVEIVQEE